MRRASRIAGAGILSGCSAAMVLGLSTPAHANLVVDPGFETPSANPADVALPTSQAGAALNPTFPWYDLLTTTGDQAEVSSDIPPFSNTPAANRINSFAAGTTVQPSPANLAHSGDQYEYSFTAGQAAGTVGGVAQLVTGITPGDSYVGSAFFFDKDDVGVGTNKDGDRFQAAGSSDTVKMIFEDSSGNPLLTVPSTIGGNSGAVSFGVAENTWIQLSTAPTIAPPLTTQVLFELPLTRGGSGGVQFADDASLVDTSTVPEPTSIGLLGACALLSLRRPSRR